MFNCFKCRLIPPKNFIPTTFSSEYKNEIWVDACLAKEISDLWDKGIRTLGCCCGHGKERGTICVHDCDAWKMTEELGYEEESYGIYYAKSDKHYYFGEVEFYTG